VNKIIYSLALLTVVLAVAGCGDDDSSGSGSAYGSRGGSSQAEKAPSSPQGAAGNADSAVVDTADVADLGTILVDSEGRTLYDFHKDEGAVSSCYGACAQAWPPLVTAGKAEAGAGIAAAKLGTTKRKDGTVQVTYAGHPLYTYVGDKGPGEANGNDIDQFGAEWYALLPSGEEPED
jgi:predicted lipoprotein with Yx(FWY)xxD motif